MDHERHDAAPCPEDLFRARYTPARSCSAPGRPRRSHSTETVGRRLGDIEARARPGCRAGAPRFAIQVRTRWSRHRRDDHIGVAALADQFRHRGYGAHHLFYVGVGGDITLE